MGESITIDKSVVAKILNEHIALIHFIKQNGDHRVMRCTLRPDLLPPLPDKKTENKVSKPPSDAVIKVWDLDKEGWRSINIDSIYGLEEPK